MATELSGDLTEDIIRCSKCGLCRAGCPVFHVYGRESWNARGRVLVARGLADGSIRPSREVLDRVYSCTLCGRCEVSCPPKARVRRILEESRDSLVDSAIGPLEDHKIMVSNVKETGNIFGKSQASSPPTSRENEDGEAPLLYGGCVATHRYPDFVSDSAALLSLDGNARTLDEDMCCGGLLWMVGLDKEFKELARQNIAAFEESGVSRVVTVCPMCYSTFKEAYSSAGSQSLEIFHISQTLAEVIDRSRPDESNMRRVNATVTYFDSCHLGRHSGIYEAPRKLLESVPGLKLIEMNENRENAWCCGGSVHPPFTEIRNQLTDKILEDATETGAEILVTACPTCFHNLKTLSLRIEVLPLTRILSYALGLRGSLA